MITARGNGRQWAASNRGALCSDQRADIVGIMVSRAVLMIALSGCSALMMSSPSPAPRSEPTCESSRVVPVLDGVAAAAVIAVASAMTLGLLAEDFPRGRIAGVAGTGLGLGIAFAVSAKVGVGRARRCEQAIAAWQTRPASVARVPR